MRNIASAAIATALAGMMAMPAPASAQSFSVSIGQQERYVSQQCRMHPNWRGCGDWKDNRHRWGKNHYRNWYLWNRPNVGTVAAGIFGFAAGAAIASSMNRNYDRYDSYNDYDDHVAACEARYRSYNAETDMFLGYDGHYHRCNL